jgi:hypothetical protein
MSQKELLLSLLIPSRRIKQLEGLIDSLKENTRDTSRIELIVKCDDDQLPEYQEYLTRKREETGLNIRWISTPRLFGVFTMWINIQLLWRAVSPGSYFVLALTDEGRFPVKNWDDEIAQYKGYYPDNIFRLRLSIARDVNYYNINQAITMPDCFPVFTRRWLELTEGFGDCWGADAIHESIAYHMGRGTGSFYAFYSRNPRFRDLVINKRLLGGIDDFAKDLKADEKKARNLLTYAEWKRVVGQAAQTRYCMHARRMLLEIYAHENGLKDYKIVHKPRSKRLVLLDHVDEPRLRVSYKLPFWFTAIAVLQFNLLEKYSDLLFRLRYVLKVRRMVIWHVLRINKAVCNAVVTKITPVFTIVKNVIPINQNPRQRTDFEDIMYKKKLVGVNKGALFAIEGQKLVPTAFMLKNIKKAQFVTCSADELTHWVEVAFSDKPFVIEPVIPELNDALEKKAS